MDQIQATIITIGDELLIGQVIDTNSAYIAQKLNSIGVQVHQRIAVGDEVQSITNALDTSIEKSQIKTLPTDHKIIFDQEVYNEAGKLLTVGQVKLYFMDASMNNKSEMPAHMKEKLSVYFS